jgi:hypothetical protein
VCNIMIIVWLCKIIGVQCNKDGVWCVGDDNSMVSAKSRARVQVCEGLHDGTGHVERTTLT